eukprot:jgi/Tetstr1/433440/TSEL_022714.t1
MADTGEAQLAQEPTELEEDPAHEDTTDLDEEVHFQHLSGRDTFPKADIRQGATGVVEAAFSAVAADLLKPCGEDWLASQVLDGEGEGEASRIQWEAVESMLEQYEEAEPADEEAGD